MNTTASAKPYVVAYCLLVALTLLTCGLSFVPHFAWHTSAGLLIASSKALGIVFVFMHLLAGSRLPSLAILAGILWLSILLGLTLADYLSRGMLSF
ncbi:MAG TPA: cytochrome C oxidase subunit IV family protein [Lacipirellulaceae bacterium]|jgi:cytochrome c oxidase subunit 4|nr:cytochrome C oxidase subunit IV family protein [Lacipirellulaceae bacterium]